MRIATGLALLTALSCSSSNDKDTTPDALVATVDAFVTPPDACVPDCAGVCGGSAVKDCAGVCNGTHISSSDVDIETTKAMFGYAVLTGSWQSFTIGKDGDLARIELQSNGPWTVPITLRIRAGQGPAGTVVRQGTIQFGMFAGTAGFTFSQLLPVTKGQTFTFDLEYDRSMAQNDLQLAGADGYTGMASIPGYPDGKMWFRTYVNSCSP